MFMPGAGEYNGEQSSPCPCEVYVPFEWTGHTSMNQCYSWDFFLLFFFLITMETTVPSRKGNLGCGTCFDNNI